MLRATKHAKCTGISSRCEPKHVPLMRQRRQCSSRCASGLRADTISPPPSGPAAAAYSSATLEIPALPTEPESPPRARVVEDLFEPAQIGATGAASTTLPVFTGQGVTLSDYMLLPVEQYFVLDPDTVIFLGGDRFTLFVPRINLLSIWVEPIVEVSVTCNAGRNPTVLLKAENCRIRGSELITNLKLDEKFVLKFQTELTWSTNVPQSDADTAAASEGADSSTHNQDLEPGTGSISASSKLDVWSEVVPPFNIMPRGALQASCNLVMRTLVGTLLPLFVHKLAEDYAKWATDAEYRRVRALRSDPKPE